MDASLKRIGLLRPAFLRAETANILTEAGENIHSPTEARPQTIDLQAMSDIRLDRPPRWSMVSVTYRLQRLI